MWSKSYDFLLLWLAFIIIFLNYLFDVLNLNPSFYSDGNSFVLSFDFDKVDKNLSRDADLIRKCWFLRKFNVIN